AGYQTDAYAKNRQDRQAGPLIAGLLAMAQHHRYGGGQHQHSEQHHDSRGFGEGDGTGLPKDIGNEGQQVLPYGKNGNDRQEAERQGRLQVDIALTVLVYSPGEAGYP